MKKIIGYSHNYLINHWEEIVCEQLEKINKSGLYDAVDAIYCGVIGNNENFQNFLSLIKPYPKISVEEYSTTPELYEFQTLDLLKTHANNSVEDYYLFYYHLKGISYPIDHENKKAYGGGKFWRQHMEKWTLEKWRENVAMLDLGYETCGTQMRVRDWPRHYSGNFFYARSEYVKLLPPVQMLDLSDRMQGEFFILSGEPIAATLSQEYVDYYTPKNPNDKLDVFKPHNGFNKPTIRPTPKHQLPITPTESKRTERKKQKKEKKGRTVVHTLCWNTVNDIQVAVRRLYQLNDRNDFEHIICDIGYPLIKHDEIPDNIQKAKQRNSEALKALAKSYGSRYVQMPNIGVSQNWTTVFAEEKIGVDDVLIGCEPDEMVHPKSTNWVSAMSDVLRSDEKYGVVSLVMAEQLPTLNANNSEARVVEGHNVIDVRGGAMWAAIGISGKLLNEIGGVPYPSQYPIYGSLESALITKMDELGYKWCFLKDKLVKHPEWDFKHILRQWKHYILDANNGDQIHFEQWLELKKEGKI